MNGLDLFAGSGIGSLALQNVIPDYRTVCYVEKDAYCQAIIIRRIRDGLLHDAPVWDDVSSFNGKDWRGKVDIVSGGFPCQPFSVAGKNKGAEDERNMWPDTFRIISEVRPQYAFLENVPNLLTHKYIRRIFADLASIGYDCEWDIVGASDLGAPHRRKRVWLLAYSKGTERKQSRNTWARRDGPTNSRANVPDTGSIESGRISSLRGQEVSEVGAGGENVPDATEPRLQGQEPKGELRGRQQGLSAECGWWSIEPNVGRVAHGVANRVDRLKMLGNGWVPHVVRRILQSEIIDQ